MRKGAFKRSSRAPNVLLLHDANEEILFATMLAHLTKGIIVMNEWVFEGEIEYPVYWTYTV